MSDLVIQGLELAVMGMGFVFVFLILLVFLTTLLSRLVRLTEPDIPADLPAQGSRSRVTGNDSSANTDSRLVAVIAAAIRAHRYNKDA